MKIICSRCRILIGEQEPFDDPTKIRAKCSKCIELEKQESLQREQRQPFSGKEIIFENGWKGMLSVAGKETDEISFWELLVNGRKVFCIEEKKKEFLKYLEDIPDKDIDVTFLHSGDIPLDKSPRGRKKKQNPPPPPDKKPPSTFYNCTIRVPKEYVPPMFDDKAQRVKGFAEIMAEAALRMAREEREKSSQDTSDSRQ